MTYFIYTYERGINKKLQVYKKRNAKKWLKACCWVGLHGPKPYSLRWHQKEKREYFPILALGRLFKQSLKC
jgi:hypothetical protein